MELTPHGKPVYDPENGLYGRWRVVEPVQRSGPKVLCRCVCGTERMVNSSTLKHGQTLSCGCWQREKQSAVGRTTGRKHGKSKSPEHRAWQAIKQRCRNPNHPSYPNYGGRGIDVCDEWFYSFRAFYDHVGPRPAQPEGKRRWSIGRIDNEGNYEPGNVRWETTEQQARNQRRPRGTGRRYMRQSWEETRGRPARTTFPVTTPRPLLPAVISVDKPVAGRCQGQTGEGEQCSLEPYYVAKVTYPGKKTARALLCGSHCAVHENRAARVEKRKNRR